MANAEPALSARRLWPRRVLRILPSMKNKDEDESGVLRSLYIIRCNQNKYNKRKMKTAILSAALMLASTVAMAQKSNFQLKVDLRMISLTISMRR